MGRVSIWAQWLIIVSGVLLSPLFVLLMAGVISRSMLRKPRRGRAHQPKYEHGGVAAPPVWAGPDGSLTASVLDRQRRGICVAS